MANNGNNIIPILPRQNGSSQASLEHVLHDFCSPLNVIIGFTQLLLDEVPGKINEAQRSALSDILDSSYRLLDKVNEIFSPEGNNIVTRQ